MKHRITAAAAVLVFGGALALACGSDDTAEKLAEANERVRRVEREVEAARRSVEREGTEVEAAQQELAHAWEKLAAAKERLAEAREEVAGVADDAYVFRSVQSALLEDPELESLAISARVRNGVVTLDGRVSAKAQRERAEEIAAGTAGVVKVENRITVAAAQKGS